VTHVKGWLYTLAKNHCLMKLRSAGKARVQSFDPDHVQTADDLHLKDKIRQEEQFDQLLACIEALPPDQRTVTIGSRGNLVAVSGRVLDLNHRPLAGAYLTYKTGGTVSGTVTDEKGQFNLYVPQKDSTRQLTVAMEGYEETQYALNIDEQKGNTIYLRQSPARLDEVVVSGIGAKRKEFMAEPPSDAPEKLDSLWMNTTPAMGRIAWTPPSTASKAFHSRLTKKEHSPNSGSNAPCPRPTTPASSA
jgi:hypothetical protein